jgi:hypothetical protein
MSSCSAALTAIRPVVFHYARFLPGPSTGNRHVSTHREEANRSRSRGARKQTTGLIASFTRVEARPADVGRGSDRCSQNLP